MSDEVMEYKSGTDAIRDDLYDQIAYLMRLDTDAIAVCNEALKRVEDPDLRGAITQIREDHQRHLADLPAAMKSMEANVPEVPMAGRSPLDDGMKLIEAAADDLEISKGMYEAEQITWSRYRRIFQSFDWPLTLRLPVDAAFGDEIRHVAMVEVREEPEEEPAEESPEEEAS